MSTNIAPKLRRRVIRYMICALLFSNSLIAFIAISPLQNELYERQGQWLTALLESRADAVNRYLRNAGEIAKQITSRTMIREKLELYNQGLIPLEELVAYTQPKLQEALSKAPAISGMVRLDALGHPVLSAGASISPDVLPSRLPEGDDIWVSPLRLSNDEPGIFLAARITDGESALVGADVVAFHLRGVVDAVTNRDELGKTGEASLCVEDPSRPDEIYDIEVAGDTARDLCSLLKTANQTNASESNAPRVSVRLDQLEHVIMYSRLPSSNFLVAIAMDREELYEPANRSLLMVIGLIALVSVIFLAGAYRLLRPLASRFLLREEELTAMVAEKTRLFEDEREKLLAILEGIPENIYVVGKDNYRILYANKALKKTFADDEITGKLCHEVLQGSATPCSFCTNDIIFSKDEPYFWEQHNSISGHDYYMVDRAMNWGEGCKAHFHLAIDISRLKKAEESLKVGEERFRQAFENANDGICIVSLDGRFLQVNQRMCDIYGYSKDELESMGVNDFAYPEDTNISLNFIQRSIAGEVSSSVFEKRYIHKNGSLIWGQISSSIVRNDKGEPLHFISHMQDITDRKKTELALQKLNRSVEDSPATIVITNPNGQIEYVNPAFEQITGYSREEVLGQNPRVLSSGLHDGAFYEDMWSTITSGESWRGEFCNRKKNGELYWEQVHIAPVKDEQGNIVNFVAVKADITDKKNLERLKEDVDRIMRHDLKTPLNGVIGLSQMLLDDVTNDDQREILEMLQQSGWRMMHMIDLSLDLFKIETGNYEYTPKDVDIIHELNSVLRQKQAEIKTRKLSMQMTLDGAPLDNDSTLTAPSQPRLLFSILANLISNALEASPNHATVDIDIRREKLLVIAIRNKGVVPRAIRESFFQKYVTYGKNRGTGLGTYSAKMMSDAMGYGLYMDTWENEDMTEVRVEIPTSR